MLNQQKPTFGIVPLANPMIRIWAAHLTHFRLSSNCCPPTRSTTTSTPFGAAACTCTTQVLPSHLLCIEGLGSRKPTFEPESSHAAVHMKMAGIQVRAPECQVEDPTNKSRPANFTSRGSKLQNKAADIITAFSRPAGARAQLVQGNDHTLPRSVRSSCAPPETNTGLSSASRHSLTFHSPAKVI